jgi:hypothetical protein
MTSKDKEDTIGLLDIIIKEFTDASTMDRTYGILISLFIRGGGGRSVSELIDDHKQVDVICKKIEYLINHVKDISTLPSWQVNVPIGKKLSISSNGKKGSGGTDLFISESSSEKGTEVTAQKAQQFVDALRKAQEEINKIKIK